jgi:hypothetical protein
MRHLTVDDNKFVRHAREALGLGQERLAALGRDERYSRY